MNADLRRYYLPALKQATTGQVLDFGSGHGRVIEFLHEAGYENVHGFERDDRLRASLLPAARERTTFGADWTRFLNEKGNLWDAVILKDVLYYFDDANAEAFLRELRRHLAPGAVLAIEVFNGAVLTGPYVMHKDRGIRRIFTEQSLRDLLEAAGLSVESITGLKVPVTGVRSLMYWISSFVWKAVLRLIYWCERGTDAQNPRILEKKIFAVARAARG